MTDAVARALGAVGRVLITLGTLILAFVVYQLWGTNLHEASSQRQLDRQFAAMLASRPTTPTAPASVVAPPSTAEPSPTTPDVFAPSSTPPTAPATTTAPPTSPPATAPPDLDRPPTGDPVARIEIPAIGVDKTVVQGVEVPELKRAPGHYPDTPLPGQAGNVGIAGHRTTYGAPFGRIDQLEPGDEVTVTTLQGRFTYQVDGTTIVAPSEVSVLDARGDNRLTLTSCHPKYSARQRIVVSGVLVGAPVAGVPDSEAASGSPPAPDGAGEAPNPPVSGGEAPAVEPDGGRPRESLDADPLDASASRRPAYLWGAGCALVFALAWAAAHRVRRRTGRRLAALLAYVVAAPVFLPMLYAFFENFSRLLPSNY